MLILGLLDFDLLSDENPGAGRYQSCDCSGRPSFRRHNLSGTSTTTLSLALVDYPRSLKERFPEATYAKYCVSNCIRFAEGFIPLLPL
jgi:hypothetical protein